LLSARNHEQASERPSGVTTTRSEQQHPGSAAASPIGTAVTFPVTSNLSVESDVAYRRGRGNIHALSTSASLLYFLPRVGRATPYVAGELGSKAGFATDVRWFKSFGRMGSEEFRVAQGLSFDLGKR
jgi:hypothetical protein